MRGGGGSCGLCVGAVQTDDGATPLLTACWKGHREVAGLLLDRGAAVNQARVGFVCVSCMCEGAAWWSGWLAVLCGTCERDVGYMCGICVRWEAVEVVAGPCRSM
jgi:hypothetical protein